MRCTAVWGVIVLVCVGCGGTGLKGVDREGRASVSMREEFDPLTLNDDDISPEDIRSLWAVPPRPEPTSGRTGVDSQVVESSMRDTIVAMSSPPDSGAAGRETGAFEDVLGWRVQLSAYRTLEASEKALEEVRRRLDVPVYNEFEAPLYKIRIGNCRTEAEADKLVREARRKGYMEAWKVRTRIVVERQAIE